MSVVKFKKIVLLFAFNKSRKKFEAYNISPNKPDERNVLWIIKNSLKFFKLKKININISKNPFKEKKYLRLNNFKIKKYLNFDLSLSINERLNLTLGWYKKFFDNDKNLEAFTKYQINYVHKKYKIIK